MTTPATAPSATYTPPVSGSRFVWHDLMSVDAPAAHAFYSALFGWTTQIMPMGKLGDYHMVSAGEHGVGGVMPLDPTHGMPSHWVAYLAVADVDAACAQASTIGGTTHVPPTDIPNVGRFAVVEDPTGAIFSPFSSTSEAPPIPATPHVGTVAWNELLTKDPATATAFYAALTGWSTRQLDTPNGPYHLFLRGEENIAGLMPMPAEAPARANWLPYFRVARVDDSVASIMALGGSVMLKPMNVQGWGRIAVAKDPTGATFGVLEFLQTM